MNLTQIKDCYCKLRDSLVALTAKVESDSYSVYRLAPNDSPGILNREWSGPEPVVPIADSDTAVGRDFRLSHDFSQATTVNTVVTDLRLNDTDNTAGGLVDRQTLDTVISVPSGGIWIQYTGGSEGYWAIEVGECCGPLVLKAELGYQDREDSAAIVGPVFIPEGQHYFRAWNIDSGGTNSSHTDQYSLDGTTFSGALPEGVEFSLGKRKVECMEVPRCNPVPEGWSKCYPDGCDFSFPNDSTDCGCGGGSGEPDTDDQRLLWDAAACELDLEDDDQDAVFIGPTTTTGTRGQIKALMNSGSLKPGRQYCITGYSRGCITGGKIFLTAQDTNMFSMDVQVLTEHDNIAWEGRYDCNTGRIVELWDNLGNHAQGISGNEVDRFPWGNTNWREVHVISADVTVPCDTALRVWNVRFETDASANLTGTTGLIYNSSFEHDSQLTIPGAAVTIQQLSMTERSRILGDNATAVIIQHTSMESESYWDFRNRNDIRSVGSDFRSTSRVYYAGGTRQWFYYTDISSRADVRQTSGVWQMYYGSIHEFADVNMNSTGTWLSYSDSFGSRSFVNNSQTNTVRSYYNRSDSRSEYNLSGTSVLNLYYNSIASYARMFISGATTVVYATEMNSQGRVQYTGGNHYRDRFTSLANITAPFNTRSVFADGAITYTLTAANTNKGSNYHHLPGSSTQALQ